MDSHLVSESTNHLSADAVSCATLEARKEGVFAGLTSGFASAILGARIMGFNRNTTLFCGVLSGVLAGYLFTQAFTSTAIARLHAEEARLIYGKTSRPKNHPAPSSL